MTRPVELLVVGAGPTGLALALQAHDHGARVRIVDRRSRAGRPSRALIVYPRTLEELRPLGVTEALLARANIAPEADLHLGTRVLRAQMGKLALRDTPFPHMTLVRQADVEAVLAQAVAKRGIELEYGVELVAVDERNAGVQATVQRPTGSETICGDFAAGCDGQASTVRQIAGIDWLGAPYAEEIILADVDLNGEMPAGVAQVFVRRRGVVLLFALGEAAKWRLLATRAAGPDPLPFGQPGPPVSLAELQAMLDDTDSRTHITSVAWSARFPLQHRLAGRFRSGRLFLAGDAAHAQSPATGQGMNTGIQDALNLGWKLAFASKASDCDGLLDSYERERRPVDRRVLALTHVAFWAEAGSGPVPALLRGMLAPLVAPAIPCVLHSRRLVAEAVRLISQLEMAYRDSSLSVEGAPPLARGPRAGERLGDGVVVVDGRSIRMQTLLATPGVHVLVQRDAAVLDPRTLGPRVKLHRMTSVPGAGVVAVRPDGYVGFRCGVADPVQLGTWLHRVGALRE